MNTFQLSKFDPHNATQAEWGTLHDYRDAIFQEANPDDPLVPREMREQSVKMMGKHPSFNFSMSIATKDDGTVIGSRILGLPKPESPDYEAQKVMVFAAIDVAFDHRRQGIGSRLLAEIVSQCRKVGDHIEWIQIESETPAGNAFAEHFGGVPALVGKENRLYAENVDWDMVQQWNDEGPNHAPGVTVEAFDGLLEDELDAFCTLYTDIMRHVPMDDLEGAQFTMTPDKLWQNHQIASERGTIWTTVISREANGAISGLTEIRYNPKRPHHIEIELTGVQEHYRGRGLGKWVKAAMMLYIQQTYPNFKYITTGNANNNAPMLSINERLGFRPYKEERMYKIRVSEIAEKLGL